MTQETRTREVAETVEVEETVTEYEAQTREESYTITVCNWCGQEYTDEEDVEFTELVQDPSVDSDLQTTSWSGLDISTLLDLIDAYYAPEPGADEWQTRTSLDRELQAVGELDWESMYQYRPDTGKAILEAIENGVRRRGGPRHDWDSHIEEAFTIDGRRTDVEEPKFLFEFKTDPEVEGKVVHICEYCKQNLDLPG